MCPHKKQLAVAILAVGCVFSSASGLSAGESPWYVIASWGRTEAEAGFGSRHPKQIDDETGSGAVAVGFTVHRNLAIQAGYHDLGNHGGFGSPCRESDESCIERLATLGLCAEGFECTEVLVGLDAEISGFSLAAVPHWPVGERFALRGKIGVMAWDSDIRARSFGRIEGFSGEDLLLGAGLQYELPKGLGVLLEHDRFDLDLSSTLLGVSWRF